MVRKNIDIDFLWIIDGVPKIRHHLFRIINTDNIQTMVAAFHHAKQNQASIRIGKSGISLPHAHGQTPLRLLGFETVVFAVLLDILQINHLTFSDKVMTAKIGIFFGSLVFYQLFPYFCDK